MRDSVQECHFTVAEARERERFGVVQHRFEIGSMVTAEHGIRVL